MKVSMVPLLAILAAGPSCGASNEGFPKGAALNKAIADETFKQITGVVVSQNGERQYESYWGEGSKDQMNDTRSATKTLVALAIGAAIDDGLISGVDAKAWSWFEAEKPFRHESTLKANITIADLLTMSSALDCNDNVWETPGNEEHMYPSRNWTIFTVDLPTKADFKRDSGGRGAFAYCTVGSFLLGQIVQRATGEPVDQYIQRRLFTPLGITSANWDRSPSGEVMTGGGTELKSKDLLALGELMLNRGVHQGQQVVSAKWIDAMTRKHLRASDNQHYGYQTWHMDFDCGQRKVDGWHMAGNGGNKVAWFPELGVVAVVTATLYGTRGMHQQSTDILNDFVLGSVEACQ
ncbi:MAG: serine hydrolase domain-containing protein [Lysobacterales bacterium]